MGYRHRLGGRLGMLHLCTWVLCDIHGFVISAPKSSWEKVQPKVTLGVFEICNWDYALKH